MKTTEQLINNIIGQLEGVKKMLQEKKDCEDIVVQLKASKSAINNLMDKILEEQSLECLRGSSKKDKERIRKLLKEIIKNN